METQRPWTAKIILRKNKSRSDMLPELNVYHKALGIKTVCYWHKNRHNDQCNRIESPEVNLHLNGQLVYDKDVKNIQGGKTDSSTVVLGKLDTYMPKKPKQNRTWLLFKPCIKINLKWINTCKNWNNKNSMQAVCFFTSVIYIYIYI